MWCLFRLNRFGIAPTVLLPHQHAHTLHMLDAYPLHTLTHTPPHTHAHPNTHTRSTAARIQPVQTHPPMPVHPHAPASQHTAQAHAYPATHAP